jgi:hypothetical protein
MSDLVERLRGMVDADAFNRAWATSLGWEAADRIEKLERALDEALSLLMKVLEKKP